MTSINFLTRRPNTQENLSYLLEFYVSSDVHFSHFEELKWSFSQCSISLHELCTNDFLVSGCQKSCIELKKKDKNLIFVWSLLQICQLEIKLLIYKLICQSTLWISVSYASCEYNRLASWNIGKTINLLRSSFQICHVRNTGFIFKVKVCQKLTCLFKTVNLRETLVHMCLASVLFLALSRAKKEFSGHLYIYFSKNTLNYFCCVEVRILVEKWYIYDAHIIPRSLV